MSVYFNETRNGPFIIIKGDQWIRHGLENVDLIGFELKKFNELIKLGKTLRPELRHVVEGGCNMGSWVIPIARENPDLDFYSFEVQRFVYYVNCGNMALNNTMNVFSHWCGLSDKCGEIQIPVPDYNDFGNFGAFEVQAPFTNSDCDLNYVDRVDTVKTVSIDSLNLNPVFMKLDVEGMEWLVIQGAKETIERCKPIIYCEKHKVNHEDVLPFFEEQNYTMTMGIDGHWLFVPPWLQESEELEKILNG